MLAVGEKIEEATEKLQRGRYKMNEKTITATVSILIMPPGLKTCHR